jgi:ketosteroid isomerase-like protein
MSTERASVEDLVRAMNRSWTEHRWEDLVSFFAEDVVALPPGGGRRIIGREAMVESYRGFTGAAEVHAFELTGVDVDIFGGTAVATARFEIRYSIGAAMSVESGADVTVLARRPDGWVIVWRTQITPPPVSAAPAEKPEHPMAV